MGVNILALVCWSIAFLCVDVCEKFFLFFVNSSIKMLVFSQLFTSIFTCYIL